ncbi:MAG: hypothetical protein IID44_21460 [Planctomycetes bacterium]|nr:hypothetical protein [Planctomycetota bacterium]
MLRQKVLETNRRWCQFSLRTLMIAVTVATVAFFISIVSISSCPTRRMRTSST